MDRSGRNVAPSSIGRIGHEIRTVRLAGDSEYRIDVHRDARLGSGRYDAGRSLLQASSREEACVSNGAQEGERYP
jgi:hypothetical protein